MRTSSLVRMAALSALLVSGAAAALEIAGSKHDFTANGGIYNSGGNTEICVFCHTPHDAQAFGNQLWNRATSDETYVLYNYDSSSWSLNATMLQPTSGSTVCLSCHDGTLAIDSVYNPPNSTGPLDGTQFLTGGSTAIGLDLSNDHPVSFVYDAALATADGELEDPANIDGALHLIGTPGSEQLACATCHDVHNNQFGSFLSMSNTGSAMCLECHLK